MSDLKNENKQKEKEYEEDLKKLWDIIKKAPREQKEQIINSLDQKTITALRTMRNPYKKPIISGDKHRYLAFNVLNITERYAQRFAMTSLIGFIYRMLSEYEPESDFISENDPKFAVPYNLMVREFVKSLPIQKYSTDIMKLESELSGLDSGNKKETRKINKTIIKFKTKIYKQHLLILKEEIKFQKDKLEKLNRDQKSGLNTIKTQKEKLENLKIKLEKKKKWDKDRTDPEISKTDPEVKLTLQEAHNMKVNDIENLISRIEQLVARLETEQIEKETKFHLLENEIIQLESKIEEQNQIFRELKNTWVREYKSNPEKLDKLEPENFEPEESDLDRIAQEIKSKLEISKTQEEYNEEIQQIIEKFLNYYFKYNPDIHVKSGYKPNYEDPTRKPLEGATELEKQIIPPDDTFARWNRYIENNYEPLRQACDDIYCEKSDFEFDIVPLEVFEGDTKEEAEEQFNSYKRKYADEFESDVFSARFNNHNLLSPWYQNREVRDFYNQRTEIIKKIIDQNKEDARIGQKLMGERAKTKKAESVKKYGPDPKSFERYKEQNPPRELEKGGAVPISQIDIPRDNNESGNNEIEVGVHVIKPKKGRRIRGYAENFKFNIPAQELKEDQIVVKHPGNSEKK